MTTTMDDGDYVLLAFSDKDPVKHSDRLFKENFIGGRPFFSPEVGQERIDACLNPQTLACDTCQSVMSFIAQINCPVDDDNDRCIHIFSCTRKSCTDRKWLVTRTITPFIDMEPEAESKEKKEDSEWLSDEDDWDQEIPAEPKNGPQKPCKPHQLVAPSLTVGTEGVNTFQSFYLTVEEEEYLLQSDRKSRSKGDKDVNMENLPDQDVGPVASDAYEKFLIPGTDDVSNKFIKRVSKFPDQVIRYNLDGQPLLNQRTNVSPTNCPSCGSRRRFELQLTPGLITALTPSKTRNERVELDFGTVLVFTCERDCGSRCVLVEEVVVLLDADEDVLKAKVHES